MLKPIQISLRHALTVTQGWIATQAENISELLSQGPAEPTHKQQLQPVRLVNRPANRGKVTRRRPY